MRQWVWLLKEWQAHKLRNALNLAIYIVTGSFIFMAIGLMDIQYSNMLIPILENPSNIFVDKLLRQSDRDRISQLPGVKRVVPLTSSGTFTPSDSLDNAKVFRNVQYQDQSQIQPMPTPRGAAWGNILPKMDDIKYFRGISERYAEKLTGYPPDNLLPLSISFFAAHEYGLKLGDRVIIAWSDKVQQEYFVLRIEPFLNRHRFYVTETPALREHLINISPFNNNEIWYTSLAIYSEHPERTRKEIESILGIAVCSERGRGMLLPVQIKDEVVRTLRESIDIARAEEKAGEGRARIFFVSLFALAFFSFQRGVHLNRRKMYALLYAFGMSRVLITIQVLTEFFLLALAVSLGSASLGKIIIERLLGLYVSNELFLRYSLPLVLVVLVISLLFSAVISFFWLQPRYLIANLRGGDK
ncbi:MAG: hypothetical protein ACLKAK_13095 [Alkaliphilus sp.]